MSENSDRLDQLMLALWTLLLAMLFVIVIGGIGVLSAYLYGEYGIEGLAPVVAFLALWGFVYRYAYPAWFKHK